MRSRNPINLYDKKNNLVKQFKNQIEVARYLDCQKKTQYLFVSEQADQFEEKKFLSS